MMEEGRYMVVEGPIGVGKAALAAKMAASLGARLIREETEANPFLAEYLRDRERFAFQAQLFFLLARFKQQQKLGQMDLFQKTTVADYLFERDRIYAQINLKDTEFGLYEQVYAALLDRVPRPDLVIYLAARTEVLWERLPDERKSESWLTPEYLKELNEAYGRFFFHYSRAPLLVVHVSDADLTRDEASFDHFLHVVDDHRRGVKHYVPLVSGGDVS